MEGGIKGRNRIGPFLLGLAAFGLVFVLGFGYSQLSFDTYTQASARSTDLQTRMDEFIIVRAKANSVVEALSDKSIHFANPSLAIDNRVFNLQTAWNDLRDDPRRAGAWTRLLAPSAASLDAGIEQFAAAALRHAVALRQGDSYRADEQVQATLEASASLTPRLSNFQHSVSESIEAAELEKQNALAGISYGQSAANGALVAFSLLIGLGLIGSGLRSLKEWIGRRTESDLSPVAAVNPGKFAAPQR